MATSNFDNPYASPRPDVPLDFREAAVVQSRQLLLYASGQPIEDLGKSLVVEVDPPRHDVLRHIGRMTLLRLVLGFGGIAAGGLLAMAQEALRARWGVDETLLLLVAAACSLSGFAILFSNWSLTRRTVRKTLGDRYARVLQLSTVRPPYCTGVEDASTFTKMKLAPEDLAYMAFDSAGRRLILEGLLYRYVIHADDVLFLGEVPGATTTGVQITFRVGEVAIAITLQMDSVWHEFRRQALPFFPGQNPLLRPMLTALRGG
jgi:hypothetical protein